MRCDMGRWVWGLGWLFVAWVGLGEVVLGLRGVVLGWGLVGFGVRVLGLGRLSLGLRRGVLGF